jgi:hypothetical protein
MSVNIGPNSAIWLKCLGNIHVEEHQFLNGTLGAGFRGIRISSLSLAPDPPGDGGLWVTSDAGFLNLRFSCFPDVFLAAGPRGQASIRTENEIDAADRGQDSSQWLISGWDVQDLNDGQGLNQVRLFCKTLGQYLNGNTVDGSVNMTDDPGNTGTRWEVVAPPVGDKNSHIPHPNR